MLTIRKHIRLSILLILPLYLILLVNSILNMHVHIMANGIVIRHAHPFNSHSEKDSPHEHTSKEFSFYHGFSVNYLGEEEIHLEQLLAIFKVEESYDLPLLIHIEERPNVLSLRGPPSFFLS